MAGVPPAAAVAPPVRAVLRCRPMSLLGTEGADDGNRVVVPQLALDQISWVQVEYLLVFQVQNAATLQASHCSVLEFVAEEGFVHAHTMARLGQREDELVLLTSTSLPKAPEHRPRARLLSVRTYVHSNCLGEIQTKHAIGSHFNVQILVAAKHVFL